MFKKAVCNYGASRAMAGAPFGIVVVKNTAPSPFVAMDPARLIGQLVNAPEVDGDTCWTVAGACPARET